MGIPTVTPIVEHRHAWGYLVGDINDGMFSRAQIVLAAGAGVCTAGLVLGQVTATGKCLPFNPQAADGSQVACAILGSEFKDATLVDRRAGATVRGPVKVNASELVWGANVQAADIVAALAHLATLGILSV